jgi:hypothetical protein
VCEEGGGGGGPFFCVLGGVLGKADAGTGACLPAVTRSSAPLPLAGFAR